MNQAMIIKSKYNGIPVVAALIDDKLEFLSFLRARETGNIYLGRVDHIVKNLNAAFVRYSDDKIGYLPMDSLNKTCVINRELSDTDKLHAQDEIIVQVDSEAVKTKKTKLTTTISMPGKYCVITLGRTGVGCSVKIANDLRQKITNDLKDISKDLIDEYRKILNTDNIGILVRTDAAYLSEADRYKVLMEDIEKQLENLKVLLSNGRTRTTGTRLFSHDGDSEDPMEPHITKAINFLRSHGIDSFDIKEDSGIWGISSKITELQKSRVWLKSGAYLIIEQLESFNAIDVNTGKAIQGKTDISEKVNLEAAKEIMRQIRLRNLTGMILIDFINMKSDESNEKLISEMKNLCRLDPVHTNFIDITGLGIMELTRNKNDKSLKEILKDESLDVDIIKQ